MEHQPFYHPPTAPVLVCKKCTHGIRPKQLIAHLQGTQHRITLARARQISRAIQDWDYIEDCGQWETPSVLKTLFLIFLLTPTAYSALKSHYAHLSRVQPILSDSIGVISITG